MQTDAIVTYLACMIIIFIAGKIFLVPIKKTLKLLTNSIIGAIIIYIINIIGASWNFTIGINIFTAIFIGILGVPGAILLIIIKLLI